MGVWSKRRQELCVVKLLGVNFKAYYLSTSNYSFTRSYCVAMSPFWFVAVSVISPWTCRHLGLSPFWTVAVLTIDLVLMCVYYSDASIYRKCRNIVSTSIYRIVSYRLSQYRFFSMFQHARFLFLRAGSTITSA